MKQKWSFTNLKDFFGKKSVPKLESFLNVGLYKKVCHKLKNFVKNVKKNFILGNHKKRNIVQTNVELKHYTEQPLRKEKQENKKNVNIVEKNFMLQNGNTNQAVGNIAHRNVIGRTNKKKLWGMEIVNISMEEQKNILKHFISQMNGEDYEKKFIKETIGLVKNVGKKGENCMLITKSQLENVKTPYKKQILLPCAEGVTVSNNRQEVQNGFF